jgi:hypothetical protein
VRVRLLALLLLLIPLVLPQTAGAEDASEDFAIPGGHFFPQSGFAVVDQGGIPLWKEYQRLGGVRTLGYPISDRFQSGQYVVQVTQKTILQWRPEQNQAVPTNVLDDLSAAGRDAWLLGFRSTPKPLGPEFDGGRPFDEAVKRRQALLDAEPAIKERYFAVANPLEAYGVPTSAPTDMGNHVAMRFQRAVMQRWKIDVPWAKAGEVTVANAGELARDAGMIPAVALKSTAPVLEARADRTPWSGWWWPADDGVYGAHLFDADGPLARYDRLAVIRQRPDVQTRLWELANVHLTGAIYTWAGHCNGWAAAAVLEPEPTKPKIVDGVTFSVADQKGLLSSWHFADSAEWVFGDDDEGVNAGDFHRALVQWIGAGKRPFIVNAASGANQVFNYAAYRFRLVYGPDATDPARTHVRATVWFADYNVDPGFIGTKNWPNDEGRVYEYYIVGDRQNPSGGAWEGVSATGAQYSHPWKLWYPNPIVRNDQRPLAAPQLDYSVIKSITGSGS